MLVSSQLCLVPGALGSAIMLCGGRGWLPSQHLLPGFDPGRELSRGYRLANQISLRFLAAEIGQDIEFHISFDPFSDYI